MFHPAPSISLALRGPEKSAPPPHNSQTLINKFCQGAGGAEFTPVQGLAQKVFYLHVVLVGDFSGSEPQRMNFSLLQDAFPDSGICEQKNSKTFKASAISETE